MQIHRMLDIMYILLSRERVTASDLARRFEVSTRTIYRDIEALSEANIPVYADRGKGGGIRIMEGFTVPKSLLTEKEQDEVLSALESVRAASTPAVESALSKLSQLFQRDRTSWISVDFSDWSGVDERFSVLKAAILDKRRVRFEYFTGTGEKTLRTVEPLQMWFRHRSWYLKAHCLDRDALRVFKYARMRNLRMLDETFSRELPEQADADVSNQDSWRGMRLVMRINAGQAYRVYDEFDERQVAVQPDGSFLVSAVYAADAWTLSMILSYGEQAEVMEPEWLRGLIAWRLQNACERYL